MFKRFEENRTEKEQLFEAVLNEDYRNWFNFTIKTEEDRLLNATYPTVTELRRCVTPIFGKFEIINQKKLPLTVTQEILDECPETAYVKAGNSTWAENFYSRVVSKGYAYPIISKSWNAYLVKDKEGFDRCQKDLVIHRIDYFPTDAKVGEKIKWRMDINNAEISEDNFFDSILNESSLKEFFFYAPPHNEENEEDSTIGYIAAVRDYRTQKTKYIDDTGSICDNKSQAKAFDTKGEADYYSYEHCPEGWTHFVVALKKSDILNESDNTYKAKVNGKWLKGNKLVKDEKDADVFESKTEPTQRINQMKKDDRLNKNAKSTIMKEALVTKYMACCYDPEDYYEETNYIDEDGELSCNSSGAKLFDTEDEAIDYAEDNRPYGWVSFAMPFNTTLNEASSESKTTLFDYLLEAIDDFPKNTRAMYRFARRRHNDTGAIRKVSKEPYWVHPEGVAKIVMEHGGSDIEIKAAMAHDTMEDAGVSYDDMVEKFGEEVASIVKEVTNDNDEIAKIGKERYISEELCRLSPEALTVKLADMLYNMKDSPTEKNYERMRKNVAFLMMNRHLDGKHLELAQEIMEV